MKKHKKRILQTGIWKIVLFVIWTILTMTIDVRAAGPSHTPVGFASFNSWFHHFTGVQMPLCRLLLGITDLLSVLLVVLPLYPKVVNGYVYSVNLPAYAEKAALHRTVYWCLFLSLIITGIWRLWCTCFKAAKHHKIITGVSMALSISAVVILALTGETYAVTVVFLLLLIKVFLLFRHNAAH